MAIAKVYNTGTEQWEPVLVGEQGPTGPQGPSGTVSVSSPLVNGGTSTAAELSIDKSQLAGVSHNYIINGAFDIWQRGTGPFTTNNTYTADRWRATCGGTFSVTQENFSVGDIEAIGFGDAEHFLRFDITSGQIFSKVAQRVEDVRTLAGQAATVSFWAKGTNPSDLGEMTLFLNQNFGSGGSSNVGNNQTFTLTGSWQRFELTFSLASIAGKTIGSGSHLAFEFSVGNSSQTATIDIWGVQLEAGSVATPFKRNANSIQAELAACQRYYQRFAQAASGQVFASGSIVTATTARVSPVGMTNMRTTPTFSTTGTSRIQTNGSSYNANSVSVYDAGLGVSLIFNYTAGGMATNHACAIYYGSGEVVELSAEL